MGRNLRIVPDHLTAQLKRGQCLFGPYLVLVLVVAPAHPWPNGGLGS